MQPKLVIRTRDEDGTRRIVVAGELDMDSSPQLLDAMRGALKESLGLEIVLRDVGYVDSSGIAILVQGYKMAKKKSTPFVIADPSPQALAVIRLSQLQDFFTLATSGGEGDGDAGSGGGET